MTGLVWLNVPLVVLAFLAITGLPLWLTFRWPERHPDYTEARAHFRASQRRGQLSATSAQPAAGLTTARLHAAAAATIPGRGHSGHEQPARGHVRVAGHRPRSSA